ncbi:hypothetical protein OQI_13870 [Streptomyces pharetrae CZA14]|uniref:Uncharacterized protein n=1 Tax=Streptomyces pharetrae CZA14 TaxID=1144883 RepID=A0ABX3YIY3_9ACTN|nr:hypothetical protein OQI_13870 [Streptomyces pharetrae CZA14]
MPHPFHGLHVLLGDLVLVRGAEIRDEALCDAFFEAAPEHGTCLRQFSAALRVVDGRAECRVRHVAVTLSSVTR